MKNKIAALLIPALAVLSGAAWAQGNDPETALRGDCGNIVRVSTYGDDNREEYCSQNILIRGLADSVAGLFTDGSSVTLNGSDYVFATDTLGKKQSLAPDQRFREQPVAAFCTGFLVGEDLLVTAGHCVKDHNAGNTAAPKDHPAACQQNLVKGDFCANIRVVFGFRKDLGGEIPASVTARNVYKCAEVVSHSLAAGPDYALLRLDRKVAGLKPLAINRANAGLSKDVPLFVIGHPSGIPLKIAGDAAVISSGTNVYISDNFGGSKKWVDNGYSFLTNLDTFHGNSGSPVINVNTLLVEGILVSGDRDYERHPAYPGQARATNFPQNAGSAAMGKGVGEVCTKISVPAAKIPVTRQEETLLEMNRKAGNKFYPVMLDLMMEWVREQRRQQPQNGIIPIPNHIVPVKKAPRGITA